MLLRDRLKRKRRIILFRRVFYAVMTAFQCNHKRIETVVLDGRRSAHVRKITCTGQVGYKRLSRPRTFPRRFRRTVRGR